MLLPLLLASRPDLALRAAAEGRLAGGVLRAVQPSMIGTAEPLRTESAQPARGSPGSRTLNYEQELERRRLELETALQNMRSLSGELISSPNVFRGLGADGTMREKLPILPDAEVKELAHCAWFHLASTSARRALEERQADGAADGAAHAPPSLEEILDEMRERGRAAAAASAAPPRTAASRAAASGGQPCGCCDLCQLLPDTMSDTEFRLRDSLGRAAYNKLFLHNQGLVYAEVAKIYPRWEHASVIQKADFLQEGAQGLLRAIRLFDPARGVRFSTYATWHVRAYVLRAVRDKGRLVRLPQALQHDMSLIRKARYRYAVDNQGHAPTDAQLASTLDWEASRVSDALVGLRRAEPISLDEDAYEGGGGGGATAAEQATLLARVESARGTSAAAETALYNEQLTRTLRLALREREPTRAAMTALKYGLDDGVAWTYAQLARRYNVSEVVVKGVVRTEVAYLRKRLNPKRARSGGAKGGAKGTGGVAAVGRRRAADVGRDGAKHAAAKSAQARPHAREPRPRAPRSGGRAIS